MALLREVIEVPTLLPEAFDYVADFSNAEDWDPGVVSSRQAGEPTAPRIGAAYDLVVRFRGNEQPMRYVITQLERPSRIVLKGEGTKVDAVDTIELQEYEGGTRVIYEADLHLKGVARVATPFLGSALDEMGKRALAGMRSRLAALAP
ncbi:MAG: SRPBCC family protein [Actinomycetota bacterium]